MDKQVAECGQANGGGGDCRLWAGGVPRDALQECCLTAERRGGDDVFVDAVADYEYVAGAEVDVTGTVDGGDAGGEDGGVGFAYADGCAVDDGCDEGEQPEVVKDGTDVAVEVGDDGERVALCEVCECQG